MECLSLTALTRLRAKWRTMAMLRARWPFQTRLVVVEDDVEGPVQSVLDQPAAAHGMSGPFGGQLGGGDKVSRVEAAFVLQSGARADAHDGCGVWQAQFTGKSALAFEPASLARDGDGALLDAAMALVEIDEAVEAIGWSVIEIALSVGWLALTASR